MKNLNYVLVGLIPLVFSCKKEKPTAPEVIEKPTIEKVTPLLKDSLSFKIDGVDIVAGEGYGAGLGNSGVNLKYYDKKIPDRRSWGSLGNSEKYGEPDSIMYYIDKHFSSKQGITDITFAKKLAEKEMNTKNRAVLNYTDNASLFKLGNLGLATDFKLEQKKDGFVMNFSSSKIGMELTSYNPGYTIPSNIDLGPESQKDAKFEIVKMEKVAENRLLIEARFSLNLYDINGKKYKVESGYLRLNTLITFAADNYGPPFYFF